MISTYKISRFGGSRGADELIIFENGNTGTNRYGVEVSVIDGIAADFVANGGNVPQGGFVLSGHGAAANFLQKNVRYGSIVTLDRNNMTVTVENNAETAKVFAEKRMKLLKERFELCVLNDEKYNIDFGKETINIFEIAVKNRFESTEELFEQAYYATTLPKKGEIRAIWHRPLESSAEEIRETVRRLAGYTINMLLVETFYDGYTIYPSEFAPLRPDLCGKSFDMLNEFVKAGKEFGVKIHAWVENFFVGAKQFADDTSCGSPIIDKYPHWAAVTKANSIYVTTEPGFIYLNATLEETHEFLESVYAEIIDKYAVDGLQLDYIRYPLTTSVENSVGFDYHTIDRFYSLTGIDIRTIPSMDTTQWHRFNEWRCENITKFVKRIYDLAESRRKSGRPVELSTAVFGNPDEAVRLKSQNWQKWITEGWLTFISPMAYLHYDGDVEAEVSYMVQNYSNVPNVAGITPMYSRLPDIEATKQVEACRKAGAEGVAFFETKFFTDSKAEILKKGVFR